MCDVSSATTRRQPWSPQGTLPSSRYRMFEIDPSTRQRLCPSDTTGAASLSEKSRLSPKRAIRPRRRRCCSDVRRSLLSEHGPCLVAGVLIVTMDVSSLTTKIKNHSGLAAMELGCVAFLDRGSPQAFTGPHAFDSMKRVGAASATCERRTPPRSWGDFGKFPPLVRLSARFFHDKKPPASLVVWAYAIPSQAMKHDVLLGRDTWMLFQDRSYRTMAPCPVTNRVFGELTLSLPGLQGAAAFAPDSSAPPESFHLLYAGDTGITLSRDHRLVDVDLVCSNGAPALAGCYLVNLLHAATDCFVEERIDENGRQLILLAGVADLDPDALIGTSSSPLLRVPLDAVLSDAPAPSLRLHDSGAHHLPVPGPVSTHYMGADPPSPPQCLDPFVHHLPGETAPTHE